MLDASPPADAATTNSVIDVPTPLSPPSPSTSRALPHQIQLEELYDSPERSRQTRIVMADLEEEEEYGDLGQAAYAKRFDKGKGKMTNQDRLVEEDEEEEAAVDEEAEERKIKEVSFHSLFSRLALPRCFHLPSCLFNEADRSDRRACDLEPCEMVESGITKTSDDSEIESIRYPYSHSFPSLGSFCFDDNTTYVYHDPKEDQSENNRRRRRSERRWRWRYHGIDEFDWLIIDEQQ
jgi:hypothetical protein